MAGVRNAMVNGSRNLPNGIYGRMIPKRGQVKVAVFVFVFENFKKKSDTAGVRNAMVDGGRNLPNVIYGRMIPKRGQVKLAILLGIANSVASIFSLGSCGAADALLS